MKKVILVTAFCGILGLAIPGTSLHADVGFGGRIDLGFDLLGVPALFNAVSEASDGEMAVLPIIPIMDAGFYGQFVAGPFRLGLGLRGFSVFFFINLFYPTLQAEIDIGSVLTVNAKIGGGLFYLFPVWGFTLPIWAPEAGFWLRLNPKDDRNRMQLGLGGLYLATSGNNGTGLDWFTFDNFNNNLMIYFAFKASFHFALLGKED
jgi:hypothetical protein